MLILPPDAQPWLKHPANETVRSFVMPRVSQQSCESSESSMFSACSGTIRLALGDYNSTQHKETSHLWCHYWAPPAGLSIWNLRITNSLGSVLAPQSAGGHSILTPGEGNTMEEHQGLIGTSGIGLWQHVRFLCRTHKHTHTHTHTHTSYNTYTHTHFL